MIVLPDSITTALLARYSKSLSDEIRTSQFVFSTYQSANDATNQIDTQPKYFENKIECGPKTKTCLCTRWPRTPAYTFSKDYGN